MKKIIIIFVMFLFACSWSPKDRALFTAYTTLNMIDIAQTNEIYHNENYYEINPILLENTFIPIMLATNTLFYS